jgi:Rps23 Pro-64 3,4-dihydroxylase Tpa1-like proline 4-hydroxylase|tara:strand:+ start:124 stop:318 length:195 start_codon:yes stop_codon:yes gene_type:complete
MGSNEWFKRNPEKAKEIQKKSYNKNKEQAKLRSRKQHLRGKLSYEMLTDQQKKKVNNRVEKLLT